MAMEKGVKEPIQFLPAIQLLYPMNSWGERGRWFRVVAVDTDLTANKGGQAERFHPPGTKTFWKETTDRPLLPT